MVTIEELSSLVRELMAKQKTLEEEVVDLRKRNTSLRQEKSRGILHSMTPKMKEMLEDEELLSSPTLEKCIDCIIQANKDRV